jgi:hypothetical protein
MKTRRIQERRKDTRNTELIAAGEVRKAELIEMADRLLTSQAVASILNTSKQMIEEQRKAGAIIAVRSGKRTDTRPVSSHRMGWLKGSVKS